MDYYFSEHAKQEIKRRFISLESIESTLNVPQQITEKREQRQCYQSLVTVHDKQFLLRIIVNRESPKKVITLYLTTKIKRYRR
ncbi:MAG: DUF4258 domain-containing protein [Snowella sp.]